VLRGGLGDDTFGGNPGDDEVFGGSGNDVILDDAGEDHFSGGAGDDVISVPGFGPGPPGLPFESDTISCGPGDDRVVAHRADRVAGDCEDVDRLGSGD
jgi:Ca2+-binding RTX toxin-like protein